MIDITELAHSLKAAAEKYKSVWGIARYSKAVEAREKFHELVTPANVIALVEALEKAQQRIDELESRTVKMPHRNLGHPKLFLLCPFPYYDAEDMEKALAAAGIKVESE